MTRARLTSFVHTDPGADTLIVTNMWPVEERPAYGVFVKRQIDSLIAAGLRCDVMLIHGYRSRLAYVAAALRIAGLRLARRYSLVHAHGGESIVAARWYWPGPLLVSYCGDDLLGTPRSDGRVPLLSRVRRAGIRLLARSATRTITKSAEMDRALPARLRERNTVIPNGVDTESFSPIGRDDARQQLGWSSDDRVVLFAADPAVRRKNFDLARDACEEAGARGGKVRLHVANGVDPELMPILMSACDCLILTSWLEGSPNVVKEAMACDLPVVATDVGDVREQLSDVAPSWVLPDATPAAAAAALAEAVADPVRSNGRQVVLTRLDERLIAERVLALYGELRDGSRPA